MSVVSAKMVLPTVSLGGAPYAQQVVGKPFPAKTSFYPPLFASFASQSLVALSERRLASSITRLPDRLRANLDEIGRLEKNWDDDDAEPIAPSIIRSAKEMLMHLLQEHESLREPAVVPTFDGAIQLEWHDRDRTLELDFIDAKWIALGVELASDRPSRCYTVSIDGPSDYYIATRCYEWFVRRDPRRAAWPFR